MRGRRRNGAGRTARRPNPDPCLTSDSGEVKIKGTRCQLATKYEELAAGEKDETKAENYRQHAEHYRREHNEHKRSLREEASEVHTDNAER